MGMKKSSVILYLDRKRCLACGIRVGTEEDEMGILRIGDEKSHGIARRVDRYVLQAERGEHARETTDFLLFLKCRRRDFADSFEGSENIIPCFLEECAQGSILFHQRKL